MQLHPRARDIVSSLTAPQVRALEEKIKEQPIALQPLLTETLTRMVNQVDVNANGYLAILSLAQEMAEEEQGGLKLKLES